jgi:hypothetical protein
VGRRTRGQNAHQKGAGPVGNAEPRRKELRPLSEPEKRVLGTELTKLQMIQQQIANLKAEEQEQQGRIRAIADATGGEGVMLDWEQGMWVTFEQAPGRASRERRPAEVPARPYHEPDETEKPDAPTVPAPETPPPAAEE